MGKYATNSSVPTDRSRAEIEKCLQRYGADKFGYMTETGKAMITFEISNRRVCISMPIPDINNEMFIPKRKRFGKPNTELQRENWEQACRSCWRSLAMVIKAKLESVECGISTLEREFLADIVLPGSNGKTLGAVIMPQIATSYQTGVMPPLLGMQ